MPGGQGGRFLLKPAGVVSDSACLILHYVREVSSGHKGILYIQTLQKIILT